VNECRNRTIDPSVAVFPSEIDKSWDRPRLVRERVPPTEPRIVRPTVQGVADKVEALSIAVEDLKARNIRLTALLAALLVLMFVAIAQATLVPWLG
jgi:hypothetical protein